MESKKRTCIVCGKSYSYCPVCDKDRGKPNWMFILCSHTCHGIYEILNKRGFKEITDLEAKKMLSELNVKDTEFFPEINAQIKEIFEAKEPESEVTKETEDTANIVETPTKRTKGYTKKAKTVN